MLFYFLALSAIIHHKSLSRETYSKHVSNLSQKKKVIKPRPIFKNVFRDILVKFKLVLFFSLFLFFKETSKNTSMILHQMSAPPFPLVCNEYKLLNKNEYKLKEK